LSVKKMVMKYKFVAIKYGEKKFPQLKTDDPEECKWLNQQLDIYEGKNPLSEPIDKGWSIKQFSIHTPKEGEPVFIILLERPEEKE
jgi:hypothetical protein